MLAEDVVVYSDGGGKRAAATKPVYGLSRVERFFIGLARKDSFRPASYYEPALIDGLPGFVTWARDGAPQTSAFAIQDGLITAIYMVRNPDKLRRIRLPNQP